MGSVQTELERIARRRIRQAVARTPAGCQTLPLDTLAEEAALEPSVVAALVSRMDLEVKITGLAADLDSSRQEADA
ncbi:hypothetical protein [Haloglomus litoreum]|uniref:hypothetical protein n=1 Tax=Haloglomus litoreum TaxID=3034026 RepID=UPI0023E7C5B3|nr:hypothetical protein [Haloglomus sp. DT116]